jgi:hypothetical protein
MTEPFPFYYFLVVGRTITGLAGSHFPGGCPKHFLFFLYPIISGLAFCYLNLPSPQHSHRAIHQIHHNHHKVGASRSTMELGWRVQGDLFGINIDFTGWEDSLYINSRILAKKNVPFKFV